MIRARGPATKTDNDNAEKTSFIFSALIGYTKYGHNEHFQQRIRNARKPKSTHSAGETSISE
jgi:hypothetical protein